LTEKSKMFENNAEGYRKRLS